MSSGGARPSSRVNGHQDARNRLSASVASSQARAKGERSEFRKAPSPQPPPEAFETTSHKRSASGRPLSRTRTESERHHEERKITERTYEARVERLVPRTKSPEAARQPARAAVAERRPEMVKHRSTDAKSRDSRAETPTAPWCPEVTLRSHTSAPLATRVSLAPTASTVPQAPQPKPLHEMSLEEQEAVIVEDLLFVFMGYEGQYIRYSKAYNPQEERDRLSGPTFRSMPGLDPSLQDLTQSVLKMATYYSALVAFVDVQSREEFGAVNHALCASIRKVLHDYLILIVQLETQFLTNYTFTVHVLNIQTMSTSQMMLQLYALALELLKKNALLDDESDEDEDDADDYDNIIENLREGGDLMGKNMTGKKLCKGGAVLGLIQNRLENMAGDPAARALLTTLLRDASRPYMVMLNEWLHHGAINDPHGEFLVKEQKSIRRERLEQDYTDEYWERRYTIREYGIPPQLESVKNKVLLAGKYLNVVRECGGVDVSKVVQDLPTTFDDKRFLDNVNEAYAHANESLMRLLLTSHALPARLQSIKHYFFLDPSDYFSYFLELGGSELRKSPKAVNISKLQSLLDLVLRQPGTAVALDPFKEDVKVEMNEIPLTKSLQRVVNITGIEQGEALQPLSNQPMELDKHATGFTSLQLDYAVPFPVSLVISRKTIWRYQALFRYLLSLRHLESQLSVTWQTQTRGVSWGHRSPNRALELWKRRVWTLRARMLVFVQQLLYFCTAEVIEPNWAKFVSRLKTKDTDSDQQPSGFTRTVDELMQDHVDFLDTCLKECMLTNSKLLKIHSKLMQSCSVFASWTKWLTAELEKVDPDLSGDVKPPNMTADQWKYFQATRPSSNRTGAAAAASTNNNNNNASSAAHDTSVASAGETDPEARMAKLVDQIQKWEFNFSRHLGILMNALNHYAATETVVLLSLCARLSTANQGSEYAVTRHDDDVV